MIEHIYTDGGVIKQNPSSIGGSWAWVAISELDQKLKSASGILTPEDLELPSVSNNTMELFAALRALESVPEGWEGTLVTDSRVTACRLLYGINPKTANLPPWIIKRTSKLRAGRKWKVSIVRGHPTKDELEKG